MSTVGNGADEAAAGRRTKPFTSAEYLETLRDGREIWICGERVKDVTTHPAFRNTVRMLARLYDALHDERKDGDGHGQRRLYA
jgi:4-hydroxyphenylacetate 3-monooxygenase